MPSQRSLDLSLRRPSGLDAMRKPWMHFDGQRARLCSNFRSDWIRGSQMEDRLRPGLQTQQGQISFGAMQRRHHGRLVAKSGIDTERPVNAVG